MINIFCVRPRLTNVGNDTIFLAVRGLLGEASEGEVNLISIPTMQADRWVAGLSKRAVHEMNQYGHGVLLGGGNLYENNELEVDLDALPRLQPPLLLFSLSRGRIYDRQRQLVDRTDVMPDRLIRALHDVAFRSVARDAATYDHLRGLDLAVELGGCPTLLLADLAPPLPAVPASAEGAALVSIRQPQLMSVPLRAQARVHDDVRRIIDLLRDGGWPAVRVLCQDVRDLAFASSLGDVDLVYPDDATVHLAHLRAAGVVVTYRLHTFVPCISYGTPAVNITYDERSSSLTDTIGLGAWNVDLLSGDVVGQVADRLGRLEDLEAMRAAARPRWDELAAVMRDACRAFADRARAHAAAG